MIGNLEQGPLHFIPMKNHWANHIWYHMPFLSFPKSCDQHYTLSAKSRFFHHTSWVGRMMLNFVTLRRGFLRLVQGCLRILEDGALHAGPPCSTWVWINRGTSGRNMERIMGDENQPSVVEGNKKLDLIDIRFFSSKLWKFLYWLVICRESKSIIIIGNYDLDALVD